MATTGKKKIGYWELLAIGIGGMVGGGIFAVLGLAVELARGGTPVAFAIAGFVALLTAYSYAKLSVAFSSQGGTVAFLDRAFGTGLLTGTLNVLLWLSYIVMLELYAFAFGSYGATFFPQSLAPWSKHALITLSVLSLTGLNLLGADWIGKAETWIVAAKIAILALFVATGIGAIETARLGLSTWASPISVMTGGMIIFLAYEGFELIANAAEDVRQPTLTLPRAYYTAVVLVLILYVLVAIVAVGNLSLDSIVAAKDYALAEAAEPVLGRTGFVLISIAALFSTASAINATLYGAARLSYVIATDGELPAALEKKIWDQPVGGLLITALATVGVANFFDLSSISTMGSAGFLLVFAAVNAANAARSKRTQSLWWVSVLGMLSCLLALTALIWHAAVTDAEKLWVLAALLGLALFIEAGYRLIAHRAMLIHDPVRRHAERRRDRQQ